MAIATAVLALGVFGAFAAAVFGAQQVREARRTRQAQMAVEFFRRWNDDSLVDARRLIARYALYRDLVSRMRSALERADASRGSLPSSRTAGRPPTERI